MVCSLCVCAGMHMEARGQQCMPFNVCLCVCMYWFLAGFKLRDLPTWLSSTGIKGACHHGSADLYIFLNYSPPYFLSQELSVNWKLADLTRLTSQ